MCECVCVYKAAGTRRFAQTPPQKHVFPTLAEKMPEFRPNERHKASHKLIHDGLDKVGALVEEFRKEPSSYSPARLREALDSFREPLYTHLDEEVYVGPVWVR